MNLVLIVFTFNLVICFTYLRSVWRFRKLVNHQGPGKFPPTIPYYLPYLSHLFGFISSPARFITAAIQSYGYRMPLVVRAGPLKICIISDPQKIQTVFKHSKYLTSKPSTLLALKNIFATPDSVLPFYDADDSGMAAKPKMGSRVKQEDRIHYWQAKMAHDYLSGQILAKISERYFKVLQRNLDVLNIQHEWVDIPDLYRFLQMEVSTASIETMCGSHIFNIMPSLVEDFWEFEAQIPTLVCGLPRWLVPKAWKIRRKLLDGIKAWHALAHKHSDCSKLGPEDPDWDPYFGIQLVKARQYHTLKMSSMNADARASEDLGLLFAGNANVVPAVFWFVFEALKNTNLKSRLLEETSTCMSEDNGYSIDLLSKKPLLQSVYAEVLRLRIAITMSRTPEYNDYKLGEYTIPKNFSMVIFSQTSALNAEAWTQSGRPPVKPLEDFWAERFLVFPPRDENEKTSEACGTGSGTSPIQSRQTEKLPNTVEYRSAVDEPYFSLDNTAGIWLPYGGGQRMCPGRHFAKQEILGTFALLFGKYEIEFGDIDSKKVQPDMRWATLGGLPPVCKVPIRIRKRG